MSARPRVLVFGDDDRSLLATVRSLGRRGLDVHVAGCPLDCHTLSSRYVSRAHELPPFVDGGAAWISAVRRLLETTEFQLVIPCNDESILPLSHARAQLSRYARLYLLDEDTLSLVNDKARSAALARANGVPVPRELRLSSDDDPARALEELSLPLVLKPLSSFSLGDLETRRSVRKVYSADEYRADAARMLAAGPLVVQENFVGAGVGVEILADRGDVLAAFQHVRVHEPLHGGGSSYRKSAPLDPGLLEATRKLARALAYTGVGMFEYKQDRRGAFVFLEVNGRFWGSLPLAVAAGADFPAWLYDFLVHGRRDFPQRYRVGLHCRNTLRDLRWMKANLLADKSDPTLATRSLGAVAAEIVNVLVGRERNDTLVLDDPAPGIRDVAAVAARVAKGAARSASRRWRSLHVVRRLSARSARRVVEDARSLLFVCKGNICRSPFAAALARARWPDVAVASAGYHPTPNRAAPQNAVAAARAFGVRLDAHRSAVVDAELIARADAVIVFDDSNAEALARTFSAVGRKLVRLGTFAGDGEIADPYGGDEARFRRCYGEIERAISAIDAARGRRRTRTPSPETQPRR